MSNVTEKIKERSEENRKKIRAAGPVKLIILAILVIGTVCAYVFYDEIFGANNFFDSGRIDYGTEFANNFMANIPTIIRCIQFIAITLVIVTIILAIIRKFFGRTSRSKTVSRLICNLIRWLAAIILVIAVLAIWGVDTTALITGAGVITLVVGLGMQSLIADVVAGLFIVFENAFNIGDWITVDGFRGEVIDIGIRTTKLRAAGNIKIFNNNSIQGILNQSIEPSLVKTLIDIEYGDRIPEVEKIIKEHIGEIEIEQAVDTVSYDGVAELGASGVTLQFSCHCDEGDIYAVGRELNAKVKNMFDENGIGIPFPQLVVHTAKEAK